MKILVAGGAHSLVHGNLARKLQEHGLEVIRYVSNTDGDAFTVIPPECDGVIIIRDLIGHALYHKVTDAAKVAKLPVAAIPRKWSQAEPILRLQGLLTSVPEALPCKEEKRLEPFLLTYLTQEISAGRDPKFAQVKAAVQTTLGKQVMVTQQEVNLMASRVKQTIGTKEPERKISTADIQALVDLLAEENPFALCSVVDLSKAVKAALKVDWPTVTDAAFPVSLAATELKRIRQQWETDLKWRNQCMRSYLIARMKQVVAKDLVWPSLITLYKETRELYKVSAPPSVVVEARVQVLGEWARDLGHMKETQYYLTKHSPVKGLKLKVLMADGRVKSIKTAKLRLTSKLAVQEFLDATYKKSEPLPSEPLPSEPVNMEPEVVESIPVVAEPTVTEPVELFSAVVPPEPVPLTRTSDDMLTLTSMIEDRVLAILTPLAARFTELETRMSALESKLGQPVPVHLEMPNLLKEFKGLEFSFQIKTKTGD